MQSMEHGVRKLISHFASGLQDKRPEVSATRVGGQLTTIVSPRYAERARSGVQHPVIVNCDTSGSMHGEPIAALTLGLRRMLEDLLNHPACRSSLALAISKFGTSSPFEFVVPFSKLPDIGVPVLSANGGTPYFARLIRSVEVTIAFMEYVRNELDLDLHRGWILDMTDGAAGDPELLETAKHMVQVVAPKHHIEVYLFGVPGANLKHLQAIEQPKRPAQLLDPNDNFARLFSWLYESLKMCSTSLVNDVIEVRSPNGSLFEMGT